ncbi:family 16 glycosylhydrolase [Flavobacterium sp. 5]|uniref:family 16 glycosylhydrolase n=1 Tax=Flavobacterium sp. 5 TaxID=2035199 RepID=UPI000C2C16D4|nr:family 16 glycosylhydrolase [Flavobacterium sp. 5]PKB15518.1 beta-glucanase (GH16 family) [Flavobacterium sp. 5]
MRHKYLFLIILLQFAFYSCSSNSSDNDNPIVSDVKLELNNSELKMDVGENETLTVTKAPSTNETLVWSTSNKVVATVFNGIVTAQQSGTAIITATLGTHTAQCTVTVAQRTYKLVWSDEFDGNTLNTDNWAYETGGNGWGNNEKQYYTNRPENIRVENGFLTIEARKENYEGSAYTSARIKSANKKDFAYGKIEARLKVPSGKGTWPAFWMLGYGSWPSAGEIDIMEHVGYQPKAIHCALHTKNKNGMNGQNFKGTQELAENVANDFHIITMEWVKDELLGFDRIHISIDGVETTTFGETPPLQDSGDWPFNKNFFFILNFAIGGNWGGIQGIDDTIFNNPVLYQVDYVRVYQLQ